MTCITFSPPLRLRSPVWMTPTRTVGRRYAGVTMPPSHPRPEDLATLRAALSATSEHAVTAGDDLLAAMVTVGDHTTQTAVDDLVDTAADVLREISAGCSELALSLAASLPARSGQVDETAARPRSRSPR